MPRSLAHSLVGRFMSIAFATILMISKSSFLSTSKFREHFDVLQSYDCTSQPRITLIHDSHVGAGSGLACVFSVGKVRSNFVGCAPRT